jgi:hypothetical protein
MMNDEVDFDRFGGERIDVTHILSCPRFLKVPQFLKIRNIGFPHHICTLGYFGMSVHSVYKVVCKVYLKKIHQVLVEQQEN